MNVVSLGKKLKTLRTLHGINQTQLADLLGIQRSVLSYIETDQVPMTDEQLQKTEAAFGLRLNDPQVEAAFLVLMSDKVDADQVSGAMETLQFSS